MLKKTLLVFGMNPLRVKIPIQPLGRFWPFLLLFVTLTHCFQFSSRSSSLVAALQEDGATNLLVSGQSDIESN